MNKIKLIILLGAVFIFSSCVEITALFLEDTPEKSPWNSASGELFKETFIKGCMKKSKFRKAGIEIDVSQISRDTKDSYCNCVLQRIISKYEFVDDIGYMDALSDQAWKECQSLLLEK